MNWTLPIWVVIYHPSPCYNLPLSRTERARVFKDNCPRPRLSPKLSQNLTFTQKEANRLRPAFFAVKGKFLDLPDRLARYELLPRNNLLQILIGCSSLSNKQVLMMPQCLLHLSPTWSCSLELKAGINLSGSSHRCITGIKVLYQVAVYQLTATDATRQLLLASLVGIPEV
ncbi:hypothetical protein AVEN_99749-1 [Araneus ventricosus]|uniref:Uncharacterized protein n=1 Tax=Araneus ventricosus TaxID=182803 RepID=A0A4Y2DLZ6_ARAVE|nr:hypothetical protein AVEN_99749-1 [Araneus ventricosus]